jgi:pyruvate formate lyase activating enzyme
MALPNIPREDGSLQQGIVFDIQRFALHDGPGIRTVIFLKGCSLQCKWCCNPESISSEPQLAYVPEKCWHCGACVISCPEKVLQLKPEELRVDFKNCTSCGICTLECPSGALKIIGKSMTVDEVMTEVEKDVPYYLNSGGGLTLSGGEPLLQLSFSIALLERAREKNIHTVIETAGYVSREAFERIHKVTDLFLFDYKMTDTIMHSELVGRENNIILENLHYLNTLKSNIHLRCIIVPGFNDIPGHRAAITDLANRYSSIKKVELLPYHHYGKLKYRQIGKSYRFKAFTSKESYTQANWAATLTKMGCHNVS